MSTPNIRLKNYTLRNRLGAGAYGEVWRARRDDDNKEFAIKIIPRGRTDSRAFSQEVRNLKRIRTPEGCPMHLLCYEDSWSDNDNHYLVTRYLPGVNGKEMVQDILEGKIQMTSDELVDILFDLAEAVKVVHDQGLVHRDIKPRNIQYRPSNSELTLLDFGLACLQESGKTDSCTGRRGGTPGYRAPEIRNQKVKDEAAVDIFSLGVTFYYLLTGRDLFPGKKAEDTEENVTKNRHLLIRTGNEELNQLIAQMINPRASRRPNIEAVIDALGNVPENSDLLLLSPV